MTTMKIALVSDIHANLPAFKSVLRDIKGQHVDQIWHLGDFLGYGPFPDETVRLSQKARVISIAGNYDLNVFKFPRKKDQWKRKKHPANFFSFDWTYHHLSRSTKNYLKRLPKTKTVRLEGLKILMAHGSPVSIDEPLRQDTPLKRFLELSRQTKKDVILCGHTHVFFAKEINHVWFINPGSVGRPFDGDARASYALVELTNGHIDVTHRRVSYDIEKTLRQMKKEKFPEELCQSIALGVSVEKILEKKRISQRKDIIEKVLVLARACRYEEEHSRQVTRLALRLFDQLKDLHHLGTPQRLWLEVAGLLHDIGWMKGRKAHHKVARDIILKDTSLPLEAGERKLVALVVRYHRKSLPGKSHKDYIRLCPQDKKIINRLAALLRIADGLDYAHQNLVEDLQCYVTPLDVKVKIKSHNACTLEKQAAQKKSDLFSAVFKERIVFL